MKIWQAVIYGMCLTAGGAFVGAIAQPVTTEQRIAQEIGVCTIQRAALMTENETLKARVAMLEKKISDQPPQQ